jgi:formylglycine-generating enzyme required for sulfatase activity
MLDCRFMAKIPRPILALLFSLGLLSMGSLATAEDASSAAMVWIPGRTFTMGSRLPGSHRNEQPPHEVWVDGF